MEANELTDHSQQPNEDNFKRINFLETLTSEINAKSKNCKHLEVKADYFGATCLDCGKVVAGKGFNDTAETCIHKYEYEFDTLVCTYCGHPKDPTQETDEDFE
ncbi:hypothetical protein MCERE19_04417 [Spirosomataceae bacterium]|jgi:hypothetical protein